MAESIREGSCFLILGDSGIGKSTMASTWPRPLFIDLEDRARFLGVDRIVPTSQKELLAVAAELAKRQHGYQSIVLDTVDTMLDILSSTILKAKAGGLRLKLERDDWGTLYNLSRPIILDLRAAAPHFIMTAHSKLVGDEGRQMWDLGVPGQTAGFVKKLADVAIHLVPSGENVVAVTLPSPTKELGRVWAKCCISGPDGKPALPRWFEPPTWEKIVELVSSKE